MALARTLVPPPLIIQAEGLVLQRSMSLSGYKHVGRDMNKPRPYQVKMWQNGKQARLVVAPRSGLRSTELQPLLVAIPYTTRPDTHGVASSDVYLLHGTLQEHLGYYATAEEAALCYARASRAWLCAWQPTYHVSVPSWRTDTWQPSPQLQTDTRPMPGPAARSAAPGPGSVGAGNSTPAPAPAVSGAAGVLLPAWGHSLPAVAVEPAASVTASAGARSANAHKAGERPPLQHIADSFEQHRHLFAAESLDRGAVTRPAAAAPPPKPKPPSPRPAPTQSQARTGLQNGPWVCNSIPVMASWAGLLEWQEALLPPFIAGARACYAPSVHEGLQPVLMSRTNSALSSVSAATVTGPMPPSAWLGLNKVWESARSSPLPPPPMPSEVGEADFANALHLALGGEGLQTAAPPKRACAAAGGAAADLPPMPPVTSKRPRYT